MLNENYVVIIVDRKIDDRDCDTYTWITIIKLLKSTHSIFQSMIISYNTSIQGVPLILKNWWPRFDKIHTHE